MRTFGWTLTIALFAWGATNSAAAAVAPWVARPPGTHHDLCIGSERRGQRVRCSRKPAQPYQISDTNGQWLCGDGRDNLFVVDNNGGDQITEKFGLGATQPNLLLNAGSNEGDGLTLHQCTVDFGNGDVSVSGDWGVTFNAGTCLSTGIKRNLIRTRVVAGILPRISRPKRTIHPAIFGSPATSWVARQSCRPGTREIGFIYPEEEIPSGIQIDLKGNLLIEEPNLQAIEIYPKSSLSNSCTRAPCGVPLKGTQSPGQFLLASGSELFTLDSGKIDGFRYPQGGNPNVTVNFSAIGIAIFPR